MIGNWVIRKANEYPDKEGLDDYSNDRFNIAVYLVKERD